MIQTKESCEDFKYLPKKYKYMEEGFSGFQYVQEYLTENCIRFEALDDIEAKEKMQEDIKKPDLVNKRGNASMHKKVEERTIFNK